MRRTLEGLLVVRRVREQEAHRAAIIRYIQAVEARRAGRQSALSPSSLGLPTEALGEDGEALERTVSDNLEALIAGAVPNLELQQSVT